MLLSVLKYKINGLLLGTVLWLSLHFPVISSPALSPAISIRLADAMNQEKPRLLVLNCKY
jgi:hypothetical protein